MNLSGVRLAVLERDGYRFAYCGGQAQTIDHIFSKAEGRRRGIKRWDKLWIVAACHGCNLRKGTRRLYPPSFTAYKDALARLTGKKWAEWNGDPRELGAEKLLR